MEASHCLLQRPRVLLGAVAVEVGFQAAGRAKAAVEELQQRARSARAQ